MKTVFFEVQPWERKEIETSFPNIHVSTDQLTKSNASQFSDSEIISPFIYSVLNEEILSQLPRLKMIATRSTGFDHVDIDWCKSHNIAVANVPEYGSNTVAEHTFGLILSMTRKIYQSVNQAKTLNFDHSQITGIDLAGKTIGIVGLGKIGQHVAKIAKGFEMKILAFNRSKNDQIAQEYGLTYTDLPNLLSSSDVVTLHAPLTDQTKHIINKQTVTLFKPGSYLVNTSRGGLIDTESLLIGLEKQILAGVALDVLEEEDELSEEAVILSPQFRKAVDFKMLVLNHILMNHPKVLITPHNAFNSKEALRKIVQTTLENISAFQEGKQYAKVV